MSPLVPIMVLSALWLTLLVWAWQDRRHDRPPPRHDWGEQPPGVEIIGREPPYDWEQEGE